MVEETRLQKWEREWATYDAWDRKMQMWQDALFGMLMVLIPLLLINL